MTRRFLAHGPMGSFRQPGRVAASPSWPGGRSNTSTGRVFYVSEFGSALKPLEKTARAGSARCPLPARCPPDLSFGLAYVTFMARERRRNRVTYPLALLALLWIAPFYGFFSAPLFLGVSEQAGLAAAGWLSGAQPPRGEGVTHPVTTAQPGRPAVDAYLPATSRLDLSAVLGRPISNGRVDADRPTRGSADSPRGSP